MRKTIRVIGGGLAGSEAAYRLATRGFSVELWEMRPVRKTEAHQGGGLAELVCSNSFKSLSLATAPGILKAEMDLLGSISLAAARRAAVPAGEALAVDREVFSNFITSVLESHPNIRIHREEFTAIDLHQPDPIIVATGPLTSPALAEAIQELSGEKEFYFYDAISPIVSQSGVDFSKAFFANRHGKESRRFKSEGDAGETAGTGEKSEGDYINCPLSRAEYETFIDALLGAERVPAKDFERVKHFEGCMPIEEMADRGRETLRFGPMRPVGIVDPHTGRRPWAVVQLRPENREATMYNLVGFQTKMKYGEQKRVFSLIPGLENAEILRLGSMHRNSFVDAPRVLSASLSLKAAPRVYLAGQITGVEGYMESAAVGILAAIFVEAELEGRNPPLPPRGTALGSILAHLGNEASPDFQPMGINFGLFDETAFAPTLAEIHARAPKRKKIPKAEKREAIGNAALANLRRYVDELHFLDEASARMRNSSQPFATGELYGQSKRNH